MILARVVGTVVATRKDPRLEGKKLLILKPVSPEGKDEAGYVVAVDTVSAGFKERVICVSGSSGQRYGIIMFQPASTQLAACTR